MASSLPRASIDAGRVLDALRSGMLVVDAAGCVVSCNAEARRILGLSGAGVGLPVEALLAGAQPLAELLLGALDGRERPSRGELALPRQGESQLVLGLTLSAIRTPAGDVDGVCVQFRDLAPVERADEELRLRARLEALGQTAAGLAHELRNPLAAARVQSDLLRRRVAKDAEHCDPQAEMLVDDIQHEIAQAERVVAACLDFVRPWSPALQHRVSVADLAGDALAACLSRVSFGGRAERVKAEAKPLVQGDPAALRSACEALIENALEAMLPGRPDDQLRVEVLERPVDLAVSRLGRAPDSGAECVVRVSDSGPGIEPEARSRVFYPFYSSKHEGSGLGLAAAQKIAVEHGGTLLLCEAPLGACFELCLPVCREAEVAA